MIKPVEKHQGVGAVVSRRTQRGQRIPRIGLVSVEEVLGVVYDLLVVRLGEANTLADHGQVLVQAGLEHLGHVEVPALADQGYDWRLGFEQSL